MNDEIQPISAVQPDTFVFDRQQDLTLKSYAAKAKFMTQTLFIRGFEQARAKRAVYFDGGANDFPGEFFMEKFASCLRASVSPW